MAKVKITCNTQTEYTDALRHALNNGAYSTDPAAYNPEKASIVVDDGKILQSRTDYKGGKEGYDRTVSVASFLNMSAEDVKVFFGLSKKAVVKTSTPKTVAKTISTTTVERTETAVEVKPRNVNVAPQQATLFMHYGVPVLSRNGADVSVVGGKVMYLKKGTEDLVELTAEQAAVIAKQHFMEAKVTPFTVWAMHFNLVTSASW